MFRKLILSHLIIVFLISVSCGKKNEINYKVQSVNLPSINNRSIILIVKTKTVLQKFTISEIEKIGLKRIFTKTYWKNGMSVFEGVLLKEFLESVGLDKVKSIKLIALDGYNTKIQKSEWDNIPIILATRMNGKAISKRLNGPLRIIYPRKLQSVPDDADSRGKWIWALWSIEESK